MSLIKTFLTPAILLPTIGYFAWAAGLVFLAFMEGLWNWELASDAVIWLALLRQSFALLLTSSHS